MKKISEAIFLIIEDTKSYQEQLVEDIRKMGVTSNIYKADNVTIGLKLLQSHHIDFIICDWNLPDGTGIDLLSTVRLIPKYKKIPFVMCTTESEVSMVLNAITSGASEFIIKPWSQKELVSKINSVWIKFNKN